MKKSAFIEKAQIDMIKSNLDVAWYSPNDKFVILAPNGYMCYRIPKSACRLNTEAFRCMQSVGSTDFTSSKYADLQEVTVTDVVIDTSTLLEKSSKSVKIRILKCGEYYRGINEAFFKKVFIDGSTVFAKSQTFTYRSKLSPFYFSTSSDTMSADDYYALIMPIQLNESVINQAKAILET